MRRRRLSLRLSSVLTIFAVSASLSATRAVAQVETVLYSFPESEGSYGGPTSGLIADQAGNLYGTTYQGGAYNGGTAFELMHTADGWREKILHSFGKNNGDGNRPFAGLVFDQAGNLFGTTYYDSVNGGGCVFELTREKSGEWIEKILYSFTFNTQGPLPEYPQGGVIVDAEGNIYGTTVHGGGGVGCEPYGCGTVFELTPNEGRWSFQTLHTFSNKDDDGYNPEGSLIFDASGNLYGTTYLGGPYGEGTVFQLSPQGSGIWNETILHGFSGGNASIYGQMPVDSVIFDKVGNLYGTTVVGGTSGYGTVFELSPLGGGRWGEKLVRSFDTTDGAYPWGSLALDSAGNLYGTNDSGGLGYGTAYELTPTAGGTWNETVLLEFNYTNGAWPMSGVLVDKDGNVFGTTTAGGADIGGTVFEITP
jgi:uncharacterized repeat protein (TIGR03803 family)